MTQTTLKNYIGIALDKSGSMQGITNAAKNDFNTILSNLQANSKVHNQRTIMSVVSFGVNNAYYNRYIQRDQTIVDINDIPSLTSYHATGSYTPLYESIFDIISQFESLPDAKDENVSFVVMAVTDGAENYSIGRRAELKNRIQQLQKTDRWSFILRVPVGYRHYVTNLGIPDGNIQEWETTSRGMDISNSITRSSFDSYYSSRSAGEKSTTKFFADLSNVSTETIKNTLTDISSEVLLWPISGVDAGAEIRKFVTKKLGRDMKKGAAFYQLNKPERTVQDYKKILVRDKNSNAIYAGRQARDLLNLPHDGNISLAPGNHGHYDIFIQSTSVNRKLESGTQLLYWEDTGIAFKTVSAPVQAPVVQPVPAAPVIEPKTPVAPVKPVQQGPVIGTVVTKKTAKVRNRNTKQEKIRKFVAELLKTGARNVTNSTVVTGLDTVQLLTLTVKLSTEFGINIPMKEITGWVSIQNVIDSVISRV